ncbi:antibiotic biosynthesis monooxygenase [Sedimentitalea sp. CAU 1593]|uniref:Antibiotic biosynthesis monooxygenase n=2 Tax=Sedimentitalea arenosa TaxID=2798803 RepID=A0A8J7ITS6_9RHOB|nr:antibiotic biosynthesis monooxygenase [Arenibacterium arenosum]
MFAVCVTFELAQDALPAFLPLMRVQARTSLAKEPDCHVFDICVDTGTNVVLLYELYSDAEAFQAHLGTAHFKEFDVAVTDLVRGKSVRTFPEVIRS